MKFNIADTVFVERYWAEASYENKILFKNLVKEGRLEFVGGHWVMHDEATV